VARRFAGLAIPQHDYEHTEQRHEGANGFEGHLTSSSRGLRLRYEGARRPGKVSARHLGFAASARAPHLAGSARR